MKTTPVTILILTYNRRAYFERMIKSIRNNTDYPYEITVIDNGSEPEMIDLLFDLYQVGLIDTLICNHANMFMSGWKAGLETIGSDVFVMSDPDIVVPKASPCWLTRMVDCFRQIPSLVRLGMALETDNIPPCWNKYEGRFLALQAGDVVHRNPVIRDVLPDTTLQLIHTDAFREIGGFSAEAIDVEFLKKLAGKGMCGVYQDLKALHLGWDEYKDYPSYLMHKNKRIRPYREVSLIAHYS